MIVCKSLKKYAAEGRQGRGQSNRGDKKGAAQTFLCPAASNITVRIVFFNCRVEHRQSIIVLLHIGAPLKQVNSRMS